MHDKNVSVLLKLNQQVKCGFSYFLGFTLFITKVTNFVSFIYLFMVHLIFNIYKLLMGLTFVVLYISFITLNILFVIPGFIILKAGGSIGSLMFGGGILMIIFGLFDQSLYVVNNLLLVGSFVLFGYLLFKLYEFIEYYKDQLFIELKTTLESKLKSNFIETFKPILKRIKSKHNAYTLSYLQRYIFMIDRIHADVTTSILASQTISSKLIHGTYFDKKLASRVSVYDDFDKLPHYFQDIHQLLIADKGNKNKFIYYKLNMQLKAILIVFTLN